MSHNEIVVAENTAVSQPSHPRHKRTLVRAVMQVGDGAHPWTARPDSGPKLVAKASTRLGLLDLEVLTSGQAGKSYGVYVLLFPLKRPVSGPDGQRDLFL